jgi:hypothetical protein
VVINIELGNEDHGRFPATTFGKGTETTWCHKWSPNQIKLIMKIKKENPRGTV